MATEIGSELLSGDVLRQMASIESMLMESGMVLPDVVSVIQKADPSRADFWNEYGAGDVVAEPNQQANVTNVTETKKYLERPIYETARPVRTITSEQRRHRKQVAGTVLVATLGASFVFGMLSGNKPTTADKTAVTAAPTTPETTVGSNTSLALTGILNNVVDSSISTEAVTTTTELIIPADAVSYTVKSGDKMYKIAHARKIDLQTLVAINLANIPDPNNIKPGDVIVFGAPTTTVPTTEAPTSPPLTEPLATTITATPTIDTAPAALPPARQNDGRLSATTCAAWGGHGYDAEPGTGLNNLLYTYNLPDGTPINIHSATSIQNLPGVQQLLTDFKIHDIYGKPALGQLLTECGPSQQDMTNAINGTYVTH